LMAKKLEFVESVKKTFHNNMSIKEDFNAKLKTELTKDLGLSSISAVPVIKAITLNMGIGSNRENKAFVKEAIEELSAITGQKPVLRKAKSSISNFKFRKGQLAGLSVTLRGDRMWDFYEKFVKITLPRFKDFQGVSKKSFDGGGNYNIGIKEQSVFPEIDPNKILYNKPLQVTINTSAKNDEFGFKLLKALNMPFREGK